MISIIFSERIPLELEYALRPIMNEYAEKLKGVPDLFMGFYVNRESKYSDEDKITIKEKNSHLCQLVAGFYDATCEKISQKMFEQQMGTLSLLPKEDVSPFKWAIGDEGVKILSAVIQGAKTRQDLLILLGVAPEIIANRMQMLIGFDLVTEGVEI
ncbi:MAG TPA: hypothetical protein VKK79_14790, partial [Candidatus Lokiarchaeia archaeon]|nr:hypothetical protein [Candidatus Lokiarchaeia archaeon]